jgi:hypothetical protein
MRCCGAADNRPANTCEQSAACVRKDQTWWRCEPRQNGESNIPALHGRISCQHSSHMCADHRPLRLAGPASLKDRRACAKSCKLLRLCADLQAPSLSVAPKATGHTHPKLRRMCVSCTQCVTRQSIPGRSVVEAKKVPLPTRPAASMEMFAAAKTPAGGGVSLLASTTTTTVRIMDPLQGCSVAVPAVMTGSNLQDNMLDWQTLCRLAILQT